MKDSAKAITCTRCVDTFFFGLGSWWLHLIVSDSSQRFGYHPGGLSYESFVH